MKPWHCMFCGFTAPAFSARWRAHVSGIAPSAPGCQGNPTNRPDLWPGRPNRQLVLWR